MTFIKLCFLLCSVSVCLVGCNQSQITKEIERCVVANVLEDTVLLSDIQPPEFMKRFAVMYYGSNTADVIWGWSENTITDAFFWPTSSYPGFGYTVILQYDYFDGSDTITLKTKYGEYLYALSDKINTFKESETLYSRDTGENLNQLNPFNEQLLVYSEITNIVYCFSMERGTRIVIE